MIACTRSAALALAAVVASPAAAQLLAYDGFGNGPLTDLAGSNGGSGWTVPWSMVGPSPTAVDTNGLLFPGLESTPGGAVTAFDPAPNASTAYTRTVTALPAGTNWYYVSFLLRLDAGVDLGPATMAGLKFQTFGATPSQCLVGVPQGTGTMGLVANTTWETDQDLTTTPLVAGATNLIVVRVASFAQPAVLSYRFYINPAIDQPEPGFYDATAWAVGVSALPTSITLTNSTGFTTDEIRVGKTWASVLPLAPTCPADLDQSGSVDGADLATLLGAWGTSSHDLDGDGVVTGADLAVLLGGWGPC